MIALERFVAMVSTVSLRGIVLGSEEEGAIEGVMILYCRERSVLWIDRRSRWDRGIIRPR